jgi:hypothetical protein
MSVSVEFNALVSCLNYATYSNIATNVLCNYLFIPCILHISTYITNLNPLVTLQKRAIRIITFSDYRVNISPLFKMLNLLKLLDILKLHSGIFMLCYCDGLLQLILTTFSVKLNISMHIIPGWRQK